MVYALQPTEGGAGVTVWDNAWNANEWFVVIFTVIGYGSVWLLPRRFSKGAAVLYLTLGVFYGVLFDHIISVKPFDFYDVNDTSNFQFLDFVTYLMYGPFAYLFLYIYDWLRITHRYAAFYVLLWTAFGMVMEGAAGYFGVFHFKNGYEYDYSSPVYLFLQISLLGLYYSGTGKLERAAAK
jgi:hypothetical protein